MVDASVRGAEQLGELAQRLRAAGDQGKGLRKEMYKGLNRATKPLRIKAQEAAARELPQSGGLAALVAKQRFSTKISTGRDAKVSITTKGAAVTTDKGFVMRPVWGRAPLVRQEVKGGWFTETMQKGSDEVRKELNEAIETVARQITRG